MISNRGKPIWVVHRGACEHSNIDADQNRRGNYILRIIEYLGIPIVTLFNDQLHLDIFYARCQDTGDSTSYENAKIFKEEMIKRNVKNAK